MRRNESCLFWVLLLSACTSLSPQDWQAFPKNFIAEQSLRVSYKDTEQKILAQVQREGEQLKLVFLDPLWQTVIATAQWNGKGEPNLNVRLAPRDVHNLPLDEVTRGVYQLYMSSEFVRVEDSWTLAMSKQKWIWHLSNIEGEAGCAYPRRIILEFSEHHAVVEVTTKSMSCTD